MKIIEVENKAKKSKVLGITCPKCGGDIATLDLPNYRSKVIKAATLGLVVMQTLVCENCHKKFSMF